MIPRLGESEVNIEKQTQIKQRLIQTISDINKHGKIKMSNSDPSKTGVPVPTQDLDFQPRQEMSEHVFFW